MSRGSCNQEECEMSGLTPLQTCSTLTHDYRVMDTFISYTITEQDLWAKGSYFPAKYVAGIIYSLNCNDKGTDRKENTSESSCWHSWLQLGQAPQRTQLSVFACGRRETMSCTRKSHPYILKINLNEPLLVKVVTVRQVKPTVTPETVFLKK